MQCENPKVSIIVPVYNAGIYITETIESVLHQTYLNWELILVDDCSTDDSKEKIAFVQDDRIRYLPMTVNRGAASARNIGLEHATGRLIAFLDADDIWLPRKLEETVSYLEEKKAAFVFTSYEFGDEEALGTGKIVRVPFTITYKQALKNTTIFTSTVMLDSDKIDKALMLMPLVKSEDTAAWWQILRSGYTGMGLNRNLVIYRRPKQSLSSNKLEAMKRIWFLYRKQEKLSVIYSAYNFVIWAVRAVMRRV